MAKRLVALCMGLFLMRPALPVEDSSGKDFCDPGLKVSGTQPLGYRNRAGRCEGIYVREVRSDTLHVASLTTAFDDYDPVSSAALQVSWVPVGRKPVRLRAEALRSRLYYRMDTVQPPDADAYAWPTNILAALNLGRPELGVLAWVQEEVEGAERPVYLPLRIGPSGAPGAANRLTLVLVPGRELRELYVSLAAVGAAGIPETLVKDGEPLAYGYYPAGRALSVPIENLPRAGTYRLELGAALADGSVATIRLWFRHAGR